MKNVTLEQVADKAVKDPEFWKGLRNDPRQTLYDNGMELAPAEARQLESILSLHGQTLTVDLDRFMESARKAKPRFGGGVSWITMWPDVIPKPPKN